MPKGGPFSSPKQRPRGQETEFMSLALTNHLSLNLIHVTYILARILNEIRALPVWIELT